MLDSRTQTQGSWVWPDHCRICGYYVPSETVRLTVLACTVMMVRLLYGIQFIIVRLSSCNRFRSGQSGLLHARRNQPVQFLPAHGPSDTFVAAEFSSPIQWHQSCREYSVSSLNTWYAEWQQMRVCWRVIYNYTVVVGLWVWNIIRTKNYETFRGLG